MSLVKSLLILFLVLTCSELLAQKSKSQLEKEKTENLKKIQEAQRILQETERKKKNTIGQLRALNQQIDASNQLIGGIREEISLLEGEMEEKNLVIAAMNDDLEKLKEEYGKMILQSYKASRTQSKLTFLFTAESFNQLVMRLQYLKQYSKSRQNQVKQIEMVREALASEKDEINHIKNEKQDLLNSEINESKRLIGLQNKQSNVVSNLKRRESELKKEVARRKKAIDRLDKLIEDLVRAELAKQRSARANLANAELTTAFEKARAKLAWPVNTGFISSPFGRQAHPVLKGIEIDNRGIDIQTRQDERVKASFSGQVASVAFVPGMNNVVLIKHGDYYTLYAKLKEVNVKRGDVVVEDQVLGSVYTDTEGISELQFQVWKKSTKLDPAKWLVKK